MAGNEINRTNETVLGDSSAAEQFAGLPLGLLICQPILEAAKGQLALCQVYINTLFEMAFDNPEEKDPDKRTTKTIKFTFDRLILDKTTGAQTTKKMTLNVPLISLVPLPAFTMDELSVDFEMEVKESNINTDTSHSDFGTTESFSFWGFDSTITGNVSADSSHTRQTDNSAKYSIHAHAVQQAPSEGMAKLTALFAQSMEPIETAK